MREEVEGKEMSPSLFSFFSPSFAGLFSLSLSLSLSLFFFHFSSIFLFTMTRTCYAPVQEHP